MKECEIPVPGFAANSGTGKTSLLVKLFPLLNDQADGLDGRISSVSPFNVRPKPV